MNVGGERVNRHLKSFIKFKQGCWYGNWKSIKFPLGKWGCEQTHNVGTKAMSCSHIYHLFRTLMMERWSWVSQKAFEIRDIEKYVVLL